MFEDIVRFSQHKWQMLLCLCSQLRDAFVYQMTQGFSHFDRQLRNDLLVIISLISSVAEDVPYVQSGLAKHLALFATFQEGCFHLHLLHLSQRLSNLDSA